MSKSTLTRRALVASTAAVPAAAALGLPAAVAEPAVAVQSLFTQGSDDPVIALAERASKAWQQYKAATPEAFSPHGREMTGYWRPDRVREAMDDLMFAEPVTLAGLAAKARVARLTDDDDVGQALMFDIGLLAGDIDPDAVPEGFERVS